MRLTDDNCDTVAGGYATLMIERITEGILGFSRKVRHESDANGFHATL